MRGHDRPAPPLSHDEPLAPFPHRLLLLHDQNCDTNHASKCDIVVPRWYNSRAP